MKYKLINKKTGKVVHKNVDIATAMRLIKANGNLKAEKVEEQKK
jgi:hypothetical protein